MNEIIGHGPGGRILSTPAGKGGSNRKFGTHLSTNTPHRSTTGKKVIRIRKTPKQRAQKHAASKSESKNKSQHALSTQVEYSVTFEAGPVGLQLEPVAEDPKFGCRVVRFVDGGPNNPGQARKSQIIQPGDFVLEARDCDYEDTANDYDGIIRILKKSSVKRELRCKSAWHSTVLETQANLTAQFQEAKSLSSCHETPSSHLSASSRDQPEPANEQKEPREKDIQRSDEKQRLPPIKTESSQDVFHNMALIHSPTDLILLSHASIARDADMVDEKVVTTCGPLIVPIETVTDKGALDNSRTLSQNEPLEEHVEGAESDSGRGGLGEVEENTVEGVSVSLDENNISSYPPQTSTPIRVVSDESQPESTAQVESENQVILASRNECSEARQEESDVEQDYLPGTPPPNADSSQSSPLAHLSSESLNATLASLNLESPFNDKDENGGDVGSEAPAGTGTGRFPFVSPLNLTPSTVRQTSPFTPSRVKELSTGKKARHVSSMLTSMVRRVGPVMASGSLKIGTTVATKVVPAVAAGSYKIGSAVTTKIGESIVGNTSEDFKKVNDIKAQLMMELNAAKATLDFHDSQQFELRRSLQRSLLCTHVVQAKVEKQEIDILSLQAELEAERSARVHAQVKLEKATEALASKELMMKALTDDLRKEIEEKVCELENVRSSNESRFISLQKSADTLRAKLESQEAHHEEELHSLRIEVDMSRTMASELEIALVDARRNVEVLSDEKRHTSEELRRLEDQASEANASNERTKEDLNHAIQSLEVTRQQVESMRKEVEKKETERLQLIKTIEDACQNEVESKREAAILAEKASSLEMQVAQLEDENHSLNATILRLESDLACEAFLVAERQQALQLSVDSLAEKEKCVEPTNDEHMIRGEALLLTTELENVKKELAEYEQSIGSLSEDVSRLRRERDSFASSLLEAEASAASLRATCSSQQAFISSLQQQQTCDKISLQEEIDELRSAIRDIDLEKESLLAEVHTLRHKTSTSQGDHHISCSSVEGESTSPTISDQRMEADASNHSRSVRENIDHVEQLTEKITDALQEKLSQTMDEKNMFAELCTSLQMSAVKMSESIEALENNLAQTEGALTSATVRERDLQANIALKDTKLADQTEELRKMKEKVSSLLDEMQNQAAAASSLEKKVEISEEALILSEKQIETLEQEKQRYQEEMEALSSQYKVIQSQVKERSALVDKLRRGVTEADFDAKEKRNQINAKLVRLATKIGWKEAENDIEIDFLLETISHGMDQCIREIAVLKQKLTSAEEECEGMKKEYADKISTLEHNLEACKSEASLLKEDLTLSISEGENLRRALSDEQTKASELNAELLHEQSCLKATKEAMATKQDNRLSEMHQTLVRALNDKEELQRKVLILEDEIEIERSLSHKSNEERKNMLTKLQEAEDTISELRCELVEVADELDASDDCSEDSTLQWLSRSELQAEYRLLEQEVHNYKLREAQLKEDHSGLKNDISRLERDFCAVRDELDAKKDALHNLEAALTREKGEKRNMKHSYADLLNESQEKSSTLRRQLDSRLAENAKLANHIETLANRIAVSEESERKNTAYTRSTIRSLVAEAISYRVWCKTYATEAENRKQELNSERERACNLSRRLESVNSTLDDQKAKLVSITTELRETQLALRAEHEVQKQFSGQVLRLEEERREEDNRRQALERKLEEAKDRLDKTEAIIQDADMAREQAVSSLHKASLQSDLQKKKIKVLEAMVADRDREISCKTDHVTALMKSIEEAGVKHLKQIQEMQAKNHMLREENEKTSRSAEDMSEKARLSDRKTAQTERLKKALEDKHRRLREKYDETKKKVCECQSLLESADIVNRGLRKQLDEKHRRLNHSNARIRDLEKSVSRLEAECLNNPSKKDNHQLELNPSHRKLEHLTDALTSLSTALRQEKTQTAQLRKSEHFLSNFIKDILRYLVASNENIMMKTLMINNMHEKIATRKLLPSLDLAGLDRFEVSGVELRDCLCQITMMVSKVADEAEKKQNEYNEWRQSRASIPITSPVESLSEVNLELSPDHKRVRTRCEQANTVFQDNILTPIKARSSGKSQPSDKENQLLTQNILTLEEHLRTLTNDLYWATSALHQKDVLFSEMREVAVQHETEKNELVKHVATQDSEICALENRVSEEHQLRLAAERRLQEATQSQRPISVVSLLGLNSSSKSVSKVAAVRMMLSTMERNEKSQKASVFRKWYSQTCSQKAARTQQIQVAAMATQLETARDKILMLKSNLKRERGGDVYKGMRKPRLRKLLGKGNKEKASVLDLGSETKV